MNKRWPGIYALFPPISAPFPRNYALNPEAKPNRNCGKRKAPSQNKKRSPSKLYALLARFTPSEPREQK